jgi:hypothetical protein
MHSVLAFLSAHWGAIVTIALIVIPALATGLSKYPKASGIVTGLRIFGDVISIVAHADSPGSLKWPLSRSEPPLQPLIAAGEAKSPPPPITAALVLLFLASTLSACAVNWQALLKDGEACGAQVAGQAIVSTINGVIASAETSIAGGNGFDSADWKNRGVALATSAGTGAVACAVAHLLGDLSGTIAGPVQPCHCNHAPVRPELKPYLDALYKRVAPRK